MPSLIVRTGDLSQAAAFAHRVLIGRKPFNGLQITDRKVSRIHAWIDLASGSYYISDAGSRGGTFVNGHRTQGRVVLHDGDEITIGPAQIYFSKSDDLPPDAVVFSIAEDGSNPDLAGHGFLLACECQAPLWAPQEMAGTYARCASCKTKIIIPGESPNGILRPMTPHDSIADFTYNPDEVELGASVREMQELGADLPKPRPSRADRMCSVCQNTIRPSDEVTACPNCSQRYHAECWLENHGCAAYGCSQVGALDEKSVLMEDLHIAPRRRPSDAVEVPVEAPEMKPSRLHLFPLESGLLVGSVLGCLVGSFTFGAPALMVGAAATVYATRRPKGENRVAALSAVICLVGLALDVVTSSWLYNVPLPWGGR
jgi:hypothetical protein